MATVKNEADISIFLCHLIAKKVIVEIEYFRKYL